MKGNSLSSINSFILGPVRKPLCFFLVDNCSIGWKGAHEGGQSSMEMCSHLGQ